MLLRSIHHKPPHESQLLFPLLLNTLILSPTAAKNTHPNLFSISEPPLKSRKPRLSMKNKKANIMMHPSKNGIPFIPLQIRTRWRQLFEHILLISSPISSISATICTAFSIAPPHPSTTAENSGKSFGATHSGSTEEVLTLGSLSPIWYKYLGGKRLLAYKEFRFRCFLGVFKCNRESHQCYTRFLGTFLLWDCCFA